MLQPVQVHQVDKDSIEERSAIDDESESYFKGGYAPNLSRKDSMEDGPLHG